MSTGFTDSEMIQHLLDRPRLYLPRRSAECLVFYLGAYHAGQQSTGAAGLVGELLEEARKRLDDGNTSRSLLELSLEQGDGDDEKAFDILCETIRHILASRA